MRTDSFRGGKNFQRLPWAIGLGMRLKILKGLKEKPSPILSPLEWVLLVAGLPSSRPTTYWARTLILTPSRPTLAIYLFATPPIKLKWWLQIGGRLLIANHVDQSVWLPNEKQGTTVQILLSDPIILLHSSLAGAQFCFFRDISLLSITRHLLACKNELHNPIPLQMIVRFVKSHR
jgi:hypothetical protein